MIEIMKKDSLKKGLSGEQAAKSKAEFGTNACKKTTGVIIINVYRSI